MVMHRAQRFVGGLKQQGVYSVALQCQSPAVANVFSSVTSFKIIAAKPQILRILQ